MVSMNAKGSVGRAFFVEKRFERPNEESKGTNRMRRGRGRNKCYAGTNQCDRDLPIGAVHSPGRVRWMEFEGTHIGRIQKHLHPEREFHTRWNGT